MRPAPPWAMSCRNPLIGHDWILIPSEWVPDTGFGHVDWFNQRCGECGLIVCRMINAVGVMRSAYKTSTYPPDYRYSQDDTPSKRDFFRWGIAAMEEQGGRRRAQRRLELVASG